jgi:hypothetical protein
MTGKPAPKLIFDPASKHGRRVQLCQDRAFSAATVLGDVFYVVGGDDGGQISRT